MLAVCPSRCGQVAADSAVVWSDSTVAMQLAAAQATIDPEGARRSVREKQENQLVGAPEGGVEKRRSSRSGSTSYASRHQLAEQRRRARINERLDALRDVVPHRDRANTAEFLDEVLTYIGRLQSRVSELQAQVKEVATPTAPPAASPVYNLSEQAGRNTIFLAPAASSEMLNGHLLATNPAPHVAMGAHVVEDSKGRHHQVAVPAGATSWDTPTYILVPASISAHEMVDTTMTVQVATKKRRTR